MSDDSTRDVSITSWSVTVRGSSKLVEAKYEEIVRALSSYGRAVVKYAPYGDNLLNAVQDAMRGAVDRVTAEQHLQEVEAEFDGKRMQGNGELEFATNVASILASKTKRLKQHSRRAKSRAVKSSLSKNRSQVWPCQLVQSAEQFPDWDQDIFMHVAIQVMASYFEQNGLQVHKSDGIRVQQLRDNVKMLISSHGNSIGVHTYDVAESAN